MGVCLNMKKITSLLLFVALLFVMFESTFADRGRRYYEQAGEIIWEINTKQKVIALTFDDGPHRKSTPEVLDLLKSYPIQLTMR